MARSITLFTFRCACLALSALVIASSLVSPASAAIPATEREVLLDIYASAGGTGWTDDTGWGGAPGTECSWFGITCDDQGSHVTYIGLGNNHLVGSLPASLSALTALKFFTVENNELTGALPSLAGMTEFQALFASSNQLSGPIPPLQGLESLQYFYVDENHLTGALPELTGLVNLHFFFATSNQLTGSVPALSGLTNLEVFAVDGNQLTGALPPFEELPALRAFIATANQLTGTIPPLTALASLQIFDVADNQLSGAPPDVPVPDGLTAGSSALCPNHLDHVDSAEWDAATGVTPWYRDCAALPDTIFENGFDAMARTRRDQR